MPTLIEKAPASTQKSRPLDATLSEIVTLHSEIITSARTSLDKAVRIGELLTEQKAKLKHGEWLPWIKANLQFSQQTVSNYVRLYGNRDKLPTVGNLELTDAYRLLCGSEPKQKADKSPPTTARAGTIDVAATVMPGEPTDRPCPPPRPPGERIVGFAPEAGFVSEVNSVQCFAIRVEEIVDEAIEANASAAQLRALSLACQAGGRKASAAAKWAA